MSNPLECAKPRVDPSVHCGLWVIMRVPVGSAVGKSVPLGCGMFMGWEDVWSGGARGLCGNSVPSAQFAVTLKLLEDESVF